MAFTKTPTSDTYQTKVIPLASSFSARNPSANTDALMTNVVVEKVDGEGEELFHLIKREGISAIPYSGVTLGTIYGLYYWRDTRQIIVVHSLGLAHIDVATSIGYACANSPSWGGGPIGFEEFAYDNNVEVLIITNGTSIGSLDALVFDFTPFTDPDLPVPHFPCPVFLDGYLFLCAALGSQNIYNSNNNDPSAWQTSGVISAESYPDLILWIARLGQYIVSFGNETIQFFYDAANPTGTPLAPQTTVLRIGFLGGLVEHGSRLYFLGMEYNGSPTVYMLDGLKATPIGTPPISRHLKEMSTEQFTTSISSNAHILTINGHSVYTWNYVIVGQTLPFPATYGFDLDQNVWIKLDYQQTDEFPIYSSTLGQAGANRTRTVTYFVMRNTTQILQFSPTAYQDLGVNFSVKFRTAPYQFSTQRIKYGSRLLILGDQTPVTSNLQIRWSDDDYKTWSAYRNVDLSNSYPALWALGAFRKRAHEVVYTDNYPFRITAMEMDYNLGGA